MTTSTAAAGERAPAERSKAGGDEAHWKAIVARFQVPDARRAIWQLINTLVPYVAVWALIGWSLTVSWWLVVPLAVLAGGLLVRVFIIFHDCGHGSFFASRRANDFWGAVTGVLTFTPYRQWRQEHAIHHGTTGDLDRRGIGDIWTLTVQEYLDASRWRRFSYRLARNPIVLFLLAPVFLFLVMQRWPRRGASTVEKHSVWWTNAALLAMGVGMSLLFGTLNYVVVQLIVLAVAGSAGVWLFYMQHQFEDAYWERGADWDYAEAALRGSSFFRLPAVLRWFSGNIGFHHVHHLSPRIPNYNLQRCHESDPLFSQVRPMTLLSSMKSFGLRLWDESSQKLVGFWRVRELRRAQRAAVPASEPPRPPSQRFRKMTSGR